jgi:hypothetical protein
MYFQKLEALSQSREYTRYYPTIEALDSWLAFLPKSYRDRVQPEMFAVNEKVGYEISYVLFKKLVELNILNERYVVQCPSCDRVISFIEELESVVDEIENYNDIGNSCFDCEYEHQLTTDNIYIIYRLVETPNLNNVQKKNFLHINSEGPLEAPKTLSQNILEDTQKYIDKIGAEALKKVGSDKIKEQVDFILSYQI